MNLHLLLIVSLTHLCYGYNILFYNSARIGQSHVFFMGKLADWLVEAGHNVTFFQQHVSDSTNKVGVKLAKAMVRPRINMTAPSEFDQSIFWKPVDVANKLFFKTFSKAQGEACRSQLLDTQLHQQLRNENYDFAVVEFIDLCSFALIEKAGITKYASLSAFMPARAIHDSLGLPLGLGVVPDWHDYLSSTFPSYSERLKCLINNILHHIYASRINTEAATSTIRTLHRADFDFQDKIAHSSYVFINVDEHLSFQHPISSKIIFIGGSDAKNRPVKPLPSDIQKIIDNSKKGVVLVSFGTVTLASQMPKEKKEAMVETFRRFPEIDFIWKYEVDDDVASNLSNVHKVKWVPQHDLLANDRLLAFITHGGLNSLSETAEMGVPTICVPFFADQTQNCQTAESHGISVMLDKMTLNADQLTKALKKILTDKSLQQKAQNMANLINNKPFSSRDRFVRYVEHAIKYNVDEVLDLPGRTQGFIRTHNLDFILFFAVVILLSAVVLYYFTKFSVLLLLRIVNLAHNNRKKVE